MALASVTTNANRLFFFVALAVSAVVVGPAVPVHTQTLSRSTPTFTKNIAPLLQDHCVVCHRAGEAAPMSLRTYEEVRPWARSIKQRVSSREMPPWFVDPTIGIKEYADRKSVV